jgi:teichoic acid transport system permease protein
MTVVFQVIREQIKYLPLIFRLASYDIKSNYQMHYLGVLWQFLNPLLRVLTYWIVFGLGMRSGQPIEGTPYLVWMLIGLIPWFFISPTIVQGSNSVYQRVNLVSKMKFPVSVLPTVSIVGNAFTFIIMLAILMGILVLNNIIPTVYWLQIPYYLLCLFTFLFSFTILSSTISVIVRDYQVMLQSVMRMLLYLTPILWDIKNLPELLGNILKLNPFYYIIQGFRDSFLSKGWFFADMTITIYFWVTTIFILLIGSIIHLKFRDKFVDYL